MEEAGLESAEFAGFGRHVGFNVQLVSVALLPKQSCFVLAFPFRHLPWMLLVCSLPPGEGRKPLWSLAVKGR